MKESDDPLDGSDPVEDLDPLSATQFKDGHSGNAKGRAKGAIGQKTIVQKVANEKRKITEDGKTSRRTTVDLVLLVLQKKALEGDLAATRYLNDLRDKFSPTEANNKGYGCLLLPELPKGTLEEQLAFLGFTIERVEEDQTVVPTNTTL